MNSSLSTITPASICDMSLCSGCCFNNKCISDSECKFLFFSSSGLLLIGLVCLLCCGCCVVVYFIYVLIYSLIKRFKKSGDKKKYDRISNLEMVQVQPTINTEVNDFRSLRNRNDVQIVNIPE